MKKILSNCPECMSSMADCQCPESSREILRPALGIGTAIAVLFLASCPEPKVPDYEITVFPPYGLDGGDAELADIPADCRLACESLAKVGCPESHPAGRSCASVCAAAQAGGRDLKPWCIANASTPDQMRACGTVRCLGR